MNILISISQSLILCGFVFLLLYLLCCFCLNLSTSCHSAEGGAGGGNGAKLGAAAMGGSGAGGRGSSARPTFAKLCSKCWRPGCPSTTCTNLVSAPIPERACQGQGSVFAVVHGVVANCDVAM